MAYDWGRSLINSGFGDWSKLSSDTKKAGSSMFDPISMGIAAAGQIGGSFFTGQANQRAAAEGRRLAEKQGLYNFMGTMQSANDARAGRAVAQYNNVFGQLGGSLYGAPSNFMWHRLAEKEKYNDLMPRQFSMAREEGRLGEEQEQTPLFRKGREDAARMDRFAGRYAAALPAMTQWGQFNLPNV
jgi:hypothetical protein